MAVVTISSEIGSGGPEIGNVVAKRMGYRYADREVITEAARRYGLAEDKLVDLDERKPSLFQRLATETRRYVLGTQAALCDFATDDNVVLMGRGGQWLLRAIPHVLRVRVTAPFELRVKRLAERHAKSGRTVAHRSLVDLVRQDDAGRAGRTRYLYDIDIYDPSLYDVLVNTSALTIDAAAESLATILKAPEFATTDECRRLVADRTLATKVEVTLATHAKTRKLRLVVEATDGVVTLEATSDLSDAVSVTRDIPGVRGVRTRQREVPPISPFPA